MPDITVGDFIEKLSSKEPVPGGGGASAVAGALAAALCSMVAQLTSGKKKYAQYQADIERITEDARVCARELYTEAEHDAEVFLPLAAAYGIPKDDPSRAGVLMSALDGACTVPLSIMRRTLHAVALCEELAEKGSRLALSDVGAAAALCSGAARAAVMNIYINAGMMTDRDRADAVSAEAKRLLSDTVTRADAVYARVCETLNGGK